MKTMLLAILLAAQGVPKGPDCVGCKKETYGTEVQWDGTPSEAGVKAKKEQKLLFLLHVSGVFEDPAFT